MMPQHGEMARRLEEGGLCIRGQFLWGTWDPILLAPPEEAGGMHPRIALPGEEAAGSIQRLLTLVGGVALAASDLTAPDLYHPFRLFTLARS